MAPIEPATGDTSGKRRFFASTRGRLVSLLRGASHTVEELAQALDLTDNAVRAHLTSLERDGLVRQQGVRRGGGAGKPASTYGLTEEGEGLFPKAYGELLRQLLAVLAERLGRDELDQVLGELARRLADGHRATGRPEQRVAHATEYVGELGGLAGWSAVEGGYRISGCCCPLAAILPGNPDACRLAELLLAEITGLPVTEHCRSNPARCEFDLAIATPK
jgi:predicted ArsR family transcriptional regulator